jgi:predicted amidophosphoribosyltransferase
VRPWTPILDLLLPPACLACGTWTRRRADGNPRRICFHCTGRLVPITFPCCARCQAPRPTRIEAVSADGGSASTVAASCPQCVDWPEPLEAVRWAWRQEGVARTLIHALKYGGWPELADDMAQTLLPLLAGLEVDPDTPLVPIPTTVVRLRQRGYNQARCLAEAIARRTGHPVLDLLERRHSRPSQVALPRDARLANVVGVFALLARRSGEGSLGARIPATVVLVDDVLTTGSTAAEATRVLVAEGVERVFLLTFARALPDASDDVRGRMPANALLHMTSSR